METIHKYSVCLSRTESWEQEFNYSAFTETGATQTMKTNQKAELKQ